MNEMNSETHSCTVSFASLAILAFGGKERFMIRAMLAIGRYLSCSRTSSDMLHTGRERCRGCETADVRERGTRNEG